MQSFDGRWCLDTKICYSCKSAAAVLFCQNDSAFLCLHCDSQIHSLSTRHPRVWLCEVCEQAPAAIACNADAATLCLACDADVHSVNPLARRHDRSPVEPFYGPAEFAVKPTSVFKFFLSNDDDDVVVLPELKSEDVFLSEMDSLVDFDYLNGGGDGVVPDQSKPGIDTVPAIDHSTGDFCGLEYCSRSKFDSVSYPSQTLSQSVSSSSIDVGVVPNNNSVSDGSYPFGKTGIPTTEEKPTQLRGIDREARVLRYREKKKNRKFEKTIRYASRKAYAEIRPRIKGRFVKRTEMDSDSPVDGIFDSFSSHITREFQYGVVPSL